ncbi:MAG: hypothetical protein MN733_32280 [Nitrososphaera sp.]|nr:hypothetical protein [Nitrososphaera sp.]
MSGKKVALVVVPVVAIAIIVAVIFASPFQVPPSQGLPETNDIANENDREIIPADTNSEPKCDAVTNRVTAAVVNIDGDGTNETRKEAARLLVDEYCERPLLVNEISAMASPGNSLVAYACDAGSGKAGDDALQDSLGAYGTVYCESAIVIILEEAEFMIEAANGYREELLQEQEEAAEDPEAFGNSTTVNMEEIEPKLQEIVDLAKRAKSLVRSGEYYDAAKSLDGASKLFEQLA